MSGLATVEGDVDAGAFQATVPPVDGDRPECHDSMGVLREGPTHQAPLPTSIRVGVFLAAWPLEPMIWRGIR